MDYACSASPAVTALFLITAAKRQWALHESETFWGGSAELGVSTGGRGPDRRC
jgi:hypothetical protein